MLQLAHMSSFNVGRLSHPDQVLYRTRRLVAQMMDVLHGSSQASGQDPWPFNNPRISLDTNVYVFKCAKISKIKVHIFLLIRCLACTITKPGQTRRETDGRRDTSPISVLNSIWSVFNATRDQWLHKLKGICWNFEANYPGGAAVLLIRKIVSKSQWVVISLQEVLKVSVCWPELGSRIELVIVLVCIL